VYKDREANPPPDLNRLLQKCGLSRFFRDNDLAIGPDPGWHTSVDSQFAFFSYWIFYFRSGFDVVFLNN